AAVDAGNREKRRAFRKQHPAAKPWEGPFPWRSVVKARRSAAHVPQTLGGALEDGTAEEAQWIARDAWHSWEVQRPTPAVRAGLGATIPPARNSWLPRWTRTLWPIS